MGFRDAASGMKQLVCLVKYHEIGLGAPRLQAQVMFDTVFYIHWDRKSYLR